MRDETTEIPDKAELGPHIETLYPVPYISAFVLVFFGLFCLFLLNNIEEGSPDHIAALVFWGIIALFALWRLLCNGHKRYRIHQNGIEAVSLFSKKTILYKNIKSYMSENGTINVLGLIPVLGEAYMYIYEFESKKPLYIRYVGFFPYAGKFKRLNNILDSMIPERRAYP